MLHLKGTPYLIPSTSSHTSKSTHIQVHSVSSIFTPFFASQHPTQPKTLAISTKYLLQNKNQTEKQIQLVGFTDQLNLFFTQKLFEYNPFDGELFGLAVIIFA